MEKSLGDVLHPHFGEEVSLASLDGIHRLAQPIGNVIHRIALGRQSQNISLRLAQGYTFFPLPLVAVGGILEISTLPILLHDDMSRLIGRSQ